MAFSKGVSTDITIKELLEKVSEAEILGYYFQIKEVPCLIHSPLRVDNHKSFGLSSLDGVSIIFKDFKTGENGNTFTLLQKYWGYSSIDETLNRINNELCKGKEVNSSTKVKKNSGSTIPKVSKSFIDLKCKIRSWKEWDIAYWKQYGISLPWLKFSNTYPISHIIVTKDGRTSIIPADKYAYVYVEFKDRLETIKIYQPYSKDFKWSNNHDSSVWDLWQQLPESGDDLIITSSRKDALCIWENTGIPSCSLQAESYLPKYHVVDILKQRFKRVWVLYDNDWEKEGNPGRTLGNKLAKEFGLTQIEIPQQYLSKDPSDLYKNHCGPERLREVIFKLINKKFPF